MRAKEKCLSTIQDIPPSDRLDTGPQKNPNYFQTYGIARCLERFEWRLIDGVLLRFIGIDIETCKAAQMSLYEFDLNDSACIETVN